MMRFFEKTKGAISIFLVIILVPMLGVSSIFVDMSRVRLAESVATSAGDLTLNTALTNYDAILKDMYGLFATSQNVEEMFDNLEEYYRKCIESSGVEDVEADNYVDQIMKMLKSETGADDLMNIDLTSFEMSSPTGGNLANPAILKTQIVEFMKYRAPINLGSGMLEAVKSFKNIKKQNKLVEDKNKFYEQQTSMMEQLEKVWGEIEDYQYRYADKAYNGDTWIFPTGSMLRDNVKSLEAIESNLEGIMDDFAQYTYWADTNYYKPIDDLGVDFDAKEKDTVFDDVWSVNVVNTDPIKKAYKEGDKTNFDDVLADLQEAYSSIEHLKKYIYDLSDENETVDANNELYYRLSKLPNATASQKIYTISLFNSNRNYVKALERMITALYNLQCSYECCTEKDRVQKTYIVINSDGTIETVEKDGKMTMKSFMDSQLSHLDKKDRFIAPFIGYAEDLKEAYNAVNPSVSEKKSDINNKINSARDTITSYKSFLEGRVSHLTTAIGYLEDIKLQLTNYESDYNKALRDWKSSADDLSSESMGKNDASEIERVSKVLTEEKVTKLINRLTNAKKSLNNIIDQFDYYVVLGKKWLDLGKDPDNSTMRDLLTQEQKNKLKTALDGDFSKITDEFKASVQIGSPVVNWDKDPQGNPDLESGAKVALYTWLYSNFYNESNLSTKYSTSETTQTTQVTSKKGDADDAKKSYESTASNYNKESGNESTKPDRGIADYKTAGNLPSLEWAEMGNEIKEGVKADSDTSKDSETMLNNSDESGGLGMFDKIIELVDDMATTVRDDMYIANYIMNMFSYSTFESEKTVEAGGDIGAFESWYTYNDDTKLYELKSMYNTKELVDASKNLTKNPITPNSNYLYGEEVEYIIYGNTNSSASAYGTIYLIRFALNTVYAFTNAEINNITLSAATAIFGTPPLTPLIPVAKIAMTIGLALAESAYDLYTLKKGEAIPLMKNGDTFKMKPSNAAKAIAGEIATDLATAAVDKGYEILNEAIEMTDEELTKLLESGENEANNKLTELTDAAFNTTLSTMQNYANEAIQMLVDACNNVNLLNMEQNKPMTAEEKKNAVIAELDNWLASQDSGANDAIYEVKKMAVDYLKENNGAKITEVFTKIDAAATATTDALKETVAKEMDKVLTGIKETLQGKIEEATGKIGSKLNELKTEAKEELKAAAAEGAESLKNTLKEKIGATFGTSSAKDAATGNVVSSLLSWKYSDYLQLFLVVGLIASPEGVLLRTADVIELNMQLINKQVGVIEQTTTEEVSRLWGLIKYTQEKTEVVANPEAFKLNKSYTYLNIKATIDVKPILMTLPLIAPSTKSEKTGRACYQVSYEGTVGY